MDDEIDTIEGCIAWTHPSERPGTIEAALRAQLLAEVAQLRADAAAWRRLCAIDKERQATHRRPMLPRGVMDEVNAIALGWASVPEGGR